MTLASPARISEATFSAALLDPARPCPAGLVAWNGSDPAPRLAVYRNNVVASLIDALATTFPVVHQLVGTDFFRAMAAVFVRQAPPSSPVLTRYGDGFAAFVRHFGPAAGLPYLADVACLEFARVRAYHAADATPVTTEAIGRVLACREAIGDLTLVLHPSVSLVRSRHAVVSIWNAHQEREVPDEVDPDRPESALILRADSSVVVLEARGAADFIDALQRGSRLSDAANGAAAMEPSFDLSTALGFLITHGAISALHLPRSDKA